MSDFEISDLKFFYSPLRFWGVYEPDLIIHPVNSPIVKHWFVYSKITVPHIMYSGNRWQQLQKHFLPSMYRKVIGWVSGLLTVTSGYWSNMLLCANWNCGKWRRSERHKFFWNRLKFIWHRLLCLPAGRQVALLYIRLILLSFKLFLLIVAMRWKKKNVCRADDKEKNYYESGWSILWHRLLRRTLVRLESSLGNYHLHKN